MTKIDELAEDQVSRVRNLYKEPVKQGKLDKLVHEHLGWNPLDRDGECRAYVTGTGRLNNIGAVRRLEAMNVDVFYEIGLRFHSRVIHIDNVVVKKD